MSVPERLMPRTPINVGVDPATGVHVLLTMGGRSVSVDYDTANRMAVLIRGYARIAKRNAGDHSLKVIGFADLTDATLDELKAQRNRDNTAVFTRG
jgi:hypothetical protein